MCVLCFTCATLTGDFPGDSAVRIRLQRRRHGWDSWVRKIPWRRDRLFTPEFLPRECPWAKESGRLQSMGSQRVGHDWSDWASMHACNLDKISGSNHTLPDQLSSSLGWVFFWCINWVDFVFLLYVFLCHGEDRYTKVRGISVSLHHHFGLFLVTLNFLVF